MAKLYKRGKEIRQFILDNIEKHPTDIAKLTANHFNITRQAVNKHLQKLVTEKDLIESGVTRNINYELAPIITEFNYKITPELAEDIAWRNDIKLQLADLPENVVDIWNYGFNEMFNNAIDHSLGSSIAVEINKTAKSTNLSIIDNGVGIFKKIQTSLNLIDERHAVLELAKGKVTTDPKHHTGEGIFFTSRIFDHFSILSGGIYFSHDSTYPEDWILERDKVEPGTMITMQISNHTKRTSTQIFDKYTSGDEYGFNKTVVPVKLAQYGNDKLVSRSQAKRVLARVELFKSIIFDFKQVDSVGQAFADEIFRVFALEHPEINLSFIDANKEVSQMIQRAKAALNAGKDKT